MEYTKHQIRRVRDLNDEYFEVVFNKRSLNFVPGSQVKLYKDDVPIFIASGIGEPWVRIILDKERFLSKFPAGVNSIRLSLELDNPMPNLMTDKSPNFLVTSEAIGAFFSWASTYPSTKCKVCYLGDSKIQEDWIKAFHKIVSLKQLKREKNIYVMGNRELLERKATKVLNICKESYLDV